MRKVVTRLVPNWLREGNDYTGRVFHMFSKKTNHKQLKNQYKN